MKEEIARAVEVLRKGGVILYPTDTVWGIGCDATNPDAVAKVFQIKKRLDSKSLVILASDLDMICRYVKEIPEMAIQLIDVNDKPMTIVYPGALTGPGLLAPAVVAEDGSVGIRVPMTDFPCQLAARLGRPVVSTSANISGEPTPKKFSEIAQEVCQAVNFVVDPSFESGSTGQGSSIIKVGLDYSIEIIRK